MDEPPSEPSASPRDLGLILTLLLCGVVVAMGAIASAKGWIPTGDDAFLSLRTRHLIQRHPILLNNASSAGPSAGSQYNHPGAFPLTLLAPVTLIGGPGSLALATALVNAAWIAAISWMVRRIAGRRAQLGTLLVAALMVWSMGATLLVDPWNPNYGIWPVAATIVAAWGVRRLHHRLLGVVVLAASVAFQTHLSLTVLSAAIATWALIGALLHWRRAGERPVEDRNIVTRSLLVATGIGLVANAQMLVDEVFDSGNLGKILRGTGFKEATVTLRQIGAVVASKLAIPPLWLRGSWSGPVLLTELPSVASTLLGLLVVAALTTGAVLLVRRRVPALSSLLGVLAVAGVSASLVAVKFPLRIGIPLPYFRWVWPLAAIWSAAVVASLRVPFCAQRRERRSAQDERAVVARLTPIGALLVLALAGVAFIPANVDVSPNPTWAQDASRQFGRAAVREMQGKDAVVVDQSIQEAALWVIPALIDQLDAAGIDVRMSDPVLIQQTFRTYARGGGERWHFVVKGGLQIDEVPDNGRLIARHDALSPSERAELDGLVDEIGPAVARPGAVRLTSIGESETDVADLRHLTTGELPPAELLRSVPLRLALERGAVAVEGVPHRKLMRATKWGALDGGRSIALYLVDGRPNISGG